ncbi:ribonuclease D [Methylocaldum sp.]|uniref:ribonuclease D n=1 Tax=Methylocaldum sp. TaxID=1969727 RepID=UPI002D6853C5|nr:ribonuclease D [Methylocaldum sp.]HYE37633.1 ribonuclease D [Methylocaldum sp.]
MTPLSQISYIDSLNELQDFCGTVKNASWLAVDTEFLREKTYFPKFCLLQIASADKVACIDPLAFESLEPIADLLFDPAITKVFHAGRQDLEIFFHLWGRLPAPIFDTQIAAPLIGLPEQISYAGLISELLGLNLSKGHARTDWSLRPLTEAQLRYAADDVIHLGTAYLELRRELEALSRLSWPENEFAALLNPQLYENAPELAWQRIGGYYQLNASQLAVLQALAAWREDAARQQDIPRNWFVKDEVLFDLARLMPAAPDNLKLIRGLEERTIKRYGNQLCQIIQESKNRPPPAISLKSRQAKKTPEQEALLDVLTAVVRLRAAQHTLNPAVLAGRKDLEQLMEEPEQSKLLHGWRKAMAGEELEALLRGERQLRVMNGRLQMEPHG